MSVARSIRPLMLACMLVLLLFVGSHQPESKIAHSQDGGDDETCSALIDDALATMGSACAEVGNNEACYGNILVAPTLNEDADAQFETSGDIVNLDDIQALFTQPANPEDGTWGVALLTVQADLPAYSGASVTYVLFGDAQIQDASLSPPPVVTAAEPVTCDVSNSGTGNINMRGGPSTNDGIVNMFGAGETTVADGRNEAGDWVRVDYGGTGGWLYTPLIQSNCDVQTLAVVDPNAPPDTDSFTDEAPEQTYAYMQAITLESGNSEACDRSPDGLLVRSPEGRRARIVVNGVELTMSSAGFITAQADGDMVVQGLEGSIDVTSAGQTETITDGLFTTIPLDGLQADGPPTPPQPVDPNTDLPALDTANVALGSNNIGSPSCTIATSDSIVVRSGPSEQFTPYREIPSDQAIAVTGTYSDGDTTYYRIAGSGWLPDTGLILNGDCSNLPDTGDEAAAQISNGATPFCFGSDVAPRIDLQSCTSGSTVTVPTSCVFRTYNFVQGSGGGEGFDINEVLDSVTLSFGLDGQAIPPNDPTSRVSTSDSSDYVLEFYDVGPLEAGSYTLEWGNQNALYSLENQNSCTLVATE